MISIYNITEGPVEVSSGIWTLYCLAFDEEGNGTESFEINFDTLEDAYLVQKYFKKDINPLTFDVEGGPCSLLELLGDGITVGKKDD